MRMLGRIALVVFISMVALIGVLVVQTVACKGSRGIDVAAAKITPLTVPSPVAPHPPMA